MDGKGFEVRKGECGVGVMESEKKKQLFSHELSRINTNNNN